MISTNQFPIHPVFRPNVQVFEWPPMRTPLKVSDSRKKGVASRQEASERLIARILDGDAAYARKVGLVRRRQRKLRAQLTPAAWCAYLELEEAEIGRWTHALDRIAQWALAKRPASPKR